jgi:hypothetical protein
MLALGHPPLALRANQQPDRERDRQPYRIVGGEAVDLRAPSAAPSSRLLEATRDLDSVRAATGRAAGPTSKDQGIEDRGEAVESVR